MSGPAGEASAARRPIWQGLALALLTLLVYGVIAGPSVFEASPHNHYAHMASGWLEGRLELEGTPPGYCEPARRRAGECRGHRHDDWGRRWRFELHDGEVFTGIPCRTSACDEAARRLGRAYLGTDGEVRHLTHKDIRARSEQWFVTFPPGPALVFLPFAARWGVGLWDVLLTLIVGAAIPAIALRTLDDLRGRADGLNVWAAAAWAFASPALLVASHGSVWFTAQTFACAGLWTFMWGCAAEDRALAAGVGLALATSCRPHLAFAALAYWPQLRAAEGRRRRALRFALPLLLTGLGLAAFNLLRFSDPFEFGHRYLDIRWQTRMQEWGQFSPRYLLRNLHCALTLLPRVGEGSLPLQVSVHGSAVWVGSPWLLSAFALRRARAHPHTRAWLLAACAVALPALLYHNSGQRQFSYRFALDWLPLVTCALVCARPPPRLFAALALVGALYQGIGAWYFDRAPARIFVVDPPGWPFEGELRAPTRR